ncbi:small integral membrane protein 24 [Brachyhypopomus gauderio]|uniref:small integral membrane protein 24 n=1 Tax=Brachyhypopomus gauderio TaxID=698409 RepID=UPI0040433227
MCNLRNTLACLLLSVYICQAKTGSLRTEVQEKPAMQPLLVGLTAVVGFLFIIFTILIIKRIFFKKHRTEEQTEEMVHTYDNKAMDPEKGEEMKVTGL